MTISSEVRKAGPYSGNDVTTAFSFSFKVFSTADVLAVSADSLGLETDLTEGVDYTVSLNANQNANPGGTVTLTSPLATGYALVLTSQVQNLQPTDLTNQGGFYPAVINAALDRATIQIQQLSEKVDRSAKLPITRTEDVDALLSDIVVLADNLSSVNTVAGSIGSVNTVAGVSADVSTVAGNIANINAAVADLPALSAKVSKTGDTMTGPLSVPAGASGAQVPQAQEVAGWTQAFSKADPASVVFTKTGAATLSIKAGTHVAVGTKVVSYASATAITMPTHAAGTDYAVWVKDDGSIEATSNHTTPPAAGNWRKIGGYHYGLVAPATTVADGGFATTGAGMIWTQPDVDKIAGINTYSLWDLRWRPATADPRGMTLVDGGTWVDIYLCGSNHITNGTSKYNSDIASGTVLPRKPLEFGGNGTTTYSSLNWWEACEIVRSHGKRLPWNQEFVAAAYGVTEGIAIGGASSTYPNTMRNAGYTSKYGLEQATGHQWVWGLDSGYRPDGSVSPWAWRDVTGGRGQMYLYTEFANVRALFGGARDNAGFAGSRASGWNVFPWDSYWSVGLRAACDHLSL